MISRITFTICYTLLALTAIGMGINLKSNLLLIIGAFLSGWILRKVLFEDLLFKYIDKKLKERSKK